MEEEKPDKYVHLNKDKLFLLVKLLREKKKSIPISTDKEGLILKRQKYSNWERLANNILHHDGVDNLIDIFENESYNKKLAGAIKDQEDGDNLQREG